jgi:hypothetical protein
MLLIAVINISLQHLFTLSPEPAFMLIIMEGFPDTSKLFQGLLQGKKLEKSWLRILYRLRSPTQLRSA